MHIIIRCLSVFLLCLSGLTHAELETLTNEDMGEVSAQGGADISWLLQLNHSPWVSATSSPTLSADCQASFIYCRLALQFNNRSVAADGLTPQADNNGRKIWLVFKGIQGTLNLQHLRLEGADLEFTNDSGTPQGKAAISLTFDASKPLLIRNFGFNALAIEKDSSVGADNGFLQAGNGGTGSGAYSGGKYTAPGFDQGRETGFLGLSMHGNLAVKGALKVFGCPASHPRC